MVDFFAAFGAKIITFFVSAASSEHSQGKTREIDVAVNDKIISRKC